MSRLSRSLQKVSKTLTYKFGGEVTFKWSSGGVYDPEDGTVSESFTTQDTKGILEDVSSEEVSELIRSDDKKLTVAASGLVVTYCYIDAQGIERCFQYNEVPFLVDKVLMSSITITTPGIGQNQVHQVIKIDVEQIDNQAITYTLYLRS